METPEKEPRRFIAVDTLKQMYKNQTTTHLNRLLSKTLKMSLSYCKEEYTNQVNDLYKSGQYDLLIQTMSEWSNEEWDKYNPFK